MANKKSSPKKIKKRYTFQPTFGNLLVLCFGVLFLLAWAFTLGLLVGRNLMPLPFSALSSTEETASKEGKKATADHFEPIKEEDLTFYDQLVHKKARPEKEVIAEPPTSVRKLEKKERPAKKAGEESHRYSVQVAALQDKAKTEKMVGELKRLGYRAYYRQARINGKTFYRVRCGPFNTEKEARDCAKRLAVRQGFKPFIVYPEGN